MFGVPNKDVIIIMRHDIPELAEAKMRQAMPSTRFVVDRLHLVPPPLYGLMVLRRDYENG